MPKTVGDLRHILGLLGYYRRYIKDFEKLARPLFDMLEGKYALTADSKSEMKCGQWSSSTVISWNKTHQEILELLVDSITNAPVIAYPDFNKPFVVHTDASEQGLGAVLYQRQGKNCVL